MLRVANRKRGEDVTRSNWRKTAYRQTKKAPLRLKTPEGFKKDKLLYLFGTTSFQKKDRQTFY